VKLFHFDDYFQHRTHLEDDVKIMEDEIARLEAALNGEKSVIITNNLELSCMKTNCDTEVKENVNNTEGVISVCERSINTASSEQFQRSAEEGRSATNNLNPSFSVKGDADGSEFNFVKTKRKTPSLSSRLVIDLNYCDEVCDDEVQKCGVIHLDTDGMSGKVPPVMSNVEVADDRAADKELEMQMECERNYDRMVCSERVNSQIEKPEKCYDLNPAVDSDDELPSLSSQSGQNYGNQSSRRCSEEGTSFCALRRSECEVIYIPPTGESLSSTVIPGSLRRVVGPSGPPLVRKFHQPNLAKASEYVQGGVEMETDNALAEEYVEIEHELAENVRVEKGKELKAGSVEEVYSHLDAGNKLSGVNIQQQVFNIDDNFQRDIINVDDNFQRQIINFDDYFQRQIVNVDGDYGLAMLPKVDKADGPVDGGSATIKYLEDILMDEDSNADIFSSQASSQLLEVPQTPETPRKSQSVAAREQFDTSVADDIDTRVGRASIVDIDRDLCVVYSPRSLTPPPMSLGKSSITENSSANVQKLGCVQVTEVDDEKDCDKSFSNELDTNKSIVIGRRKTDRSVAIGFCGDLEVENLRRAPPQSNVIVADATGVPEQSLSVVGCNSMEKRIFTTSSDEPFPRRPDWFFAVSGINRTSEQVNRI